MRFCRYLTYVKGGNRANINKVMIVSHPTGSEFLYM